jgi:transcription initiation factor TFIID subunit 1
VNYYRGDKAHCPVSAGGGDRPARKKRTDDAAFATDTAGKLDRLPRLQGPDRPTTVLDWIGKLPKKSKEKRADEDAIDILPEGVTEMLHPKVHGPFIGEIDEGTTISALVSNLFVAPMFRHEREATDFLMILTPPSGAARPGQRESMGVILRDFPSSVFCVGQTEPRQRVNAPSSKGEKNILGPFVSYQIARALSRSQARDGHGLRLDELQDRVLPNSEISASQLRLLLKQVAIYEKDTQIWTSKQVGYDGYAGVEALAKSIPPEGIVAYETASAASRRLSDLGIHVLSSGDKTVPSVGVAMVYLAGQMNASRERWRKVKKRLESSRNTKLLSSVQTALIEKAVDDLESYFKMMRQKHEIATFIYDELQLSPWHLTGEFIDVHKESQGSGMMHLVGLGDPSGVGEGFSFLRKVENKPAKSQGNTALNASLKKITGTDDDLRKLTMKQMADILRSFGKMTEKEITNLKRWDRVHVIREFSTRAASDRMAGGLERFARDEKFKMAEQKKDYRTMINLIWKRQVTALSADLTDKAGADGDGSDTAGGETEAKASAQENIKAEAAEKEDSDSDFEDDDLVAEIEEEMISRPETKNLVAAHAQKDGGDDKDAHELAALLKQREQEKAAQEDFRAAAGGGKQFVATTSMINRKVVRRRITKTHPDGTQTTTFKFICNPEEAGKVMARLEQKPQAPKRNQELKYQYGEDEKPPGNALFEDDDDFEYSTKGRNAGKRRGGARRRSGDRAPSRGGRGTALQFGKRKTPVNKEERMRKRRRDEEDLEVYNSHAKRKTTNNRRERGSIRDRRPHVIFAEKLEAIRAAVEARPHAGPFAKPVNRRLVPSYYEKISNPMDLQTVRDKIGRYEYRTASAMIKDFELMKSNAIKFNTATAPIALEAVAIFEFVSDQIQAVRHELTGLEEQVEDQLSGKNKKRKNNETSASGTVARIGGISVNLGNLKDYDSGSGDDDEVFTGVVES